MASAATKSDDLWRSRLYVPFYKVSEAARYSRSSAQTVSRWHKLAVVPERQPRDELNYMQLIEVAVAAAMRKAGVPLGKIKAAREYFANELKSEYPFAEYRFKAVGKDIFLELQELDRKAGFNQLLRSGGQHEWRSVLEPLLREFFYDDRGIAVRWRVGGTNSAVEIDPQLSFGVPQVSGTATWVLKGRYVAGESIPDISEDFDISDNEVVDALRFEGITPDLERPRIFG